MRASTVITAVALAGVLATVGWLLPVNRPTARATPPVTKTVTAPEIDGEQVKRALEGIWNVVGELHVKTDQGRFVALKDLAHGAGDFLDAMPGETDESVSDDELRPLVESFERWDATNRSNDPALAGAVEPGTPASWGRWARRLVHAMRDAELMRREPERVELLDRERSLVSRRASADEKARAAIDAELANLRASTAYVQLAPGLTDLRRANVVVFERWRPRLEAVVEHLKVVAR